MNLCEMVVGVGRRRREGSGWNPGDRNREATGAGTG